MNNTCRWMNCRLVISLGCLVILHGVSGCNWPGIEPTAPREVTLSEFAAQPGTTTPTTEITPTQGSFTSDDHVAMSAIATPERDVIIHQPTEVDEDWNASQRSVLSAHPLQFGDQVIVDSLVGQVSGRPLFADEFFEPIEDELLALRNRLDVSRFLPQMDAIVARRLRTVVLNELILAEAEAGLSPEHKQGLFHLMRQWREGLISEHQGVASKTEETLSREGETIDSVISGRRNEMLIARQLQQKVMHRVIVSWRDIEREYQHRYDEFHQPGQVSGYRLRLYTDEQAEDIAHVTQQLNEHVDFLKVAREFDFNEESLSFAFELDRNSKPIMADGPFKDALLSLQPGQTAASFESGRFTVFVHLINTQPALTADLYDPKVQHTLRQAVFARRRIEEENRYIKSLLSGGVQEDITQMAERLQRIARLRYAP